VSGCALVDAAGDTTDASDYRLGNISNVDVAPTMALVADLDGGQGGDVVVLTNRNLKAAFNLGAGDFEVRDVLGGEGFDVIGVGKVDNTGTDAVIAAAPGKLSVFSPNESGGFEQRDLDAVALPGMPRSITTGLFGRFSPNVRCIVVSYADDTRVLVVKDVFGGMQTQTLQRNGNSAAGAVAADVKRTGAVGDFDELVAPENTGLIEANDMPAQEGFDSVGVQLGSTIQHLVAGDFAGDESADIVFARPDPPNTLGIVEGSPTGLVESSRRVLLENSPVEALVVGRFDANESQDLAALHRSGNVPQLRLLLRAGDNFVSQFLEIDQAHPVNFLAVGDLDLDGRDDFLLVPGKEGGVDLLLSR
jgi:hypothetical protein